MTIFTFKKHMLVAHPVAACSNEDDPPENRSHITGKHSVIIKEPSKLGMLPQERHPDPEFAAANALRRRWWVRVRFGIVSQKAD
jgi:hypothetical protein